MRSVYDYEIGTELTRRSRRPIRKGIKSRYLQALHWQFIASALLISILALIKAVKIYGIFNYRISLILLFIIIIARVLILPTFQILKGHLSSRLRLILSVCLSIFLLIIPIFVWISNSEKAIAIHFPSSNTQESSNDISHKILDDRPESVNSIQIIRDIPKKHIEPPPVAPPVYKTVEFKLIPYASVYDQTGTDSPRFLFESHYKRFSLQTGSHFLRFEYGGRSYVLTVDIGSAKSYTLFFNLRTGQYNISENWI